MWATEYMLHEHRKDLLRTATEIRLAREVRSERWSLLKQIMAMFMQLSLRRNRRQIETVIVMQPQCTPLGRVS
jgi:hypothetical protein